MTHEEDRVRTERLPARARRIPTNSIPSGYRRTLRLTAPEAVRPLSAQEEDLVDSAADMDVPDAETARRLSITVLPSTTPYVLVQYRVPITSLREFDGTCHDHGQYGHVATSVSCGVVTVRPAGPIGLVVVRLKPEAAPRFLRGCMGAFANAKIALADMLGPGVTRVLEEKVSQARTSAERITLVTDFLRANLRASDPDPLVAHAARALRDRPRLRIRLLAAELGISERQLCRRFRAIFGAGPKEFARMARLEEVLAARAAGHAWASLSHACGFTDQAHMINDTRAILGASPEQVLAPAVIGQHAGRGESQSAPLFVW